ncbi:MAG: nucleoside hydrolase [Cyanobacteriota bacterium]|nr:nucleoside hydrolase [Cyanobacteriota bacterium]
MVKRLLIDTDTAGDDAVSILFGILWPDTSVEAITIAAGNLPLDPCVENALYTLEVAGKTGIPVFAGASRPLVRPLVTAEYVHGQDGMGNSYFPKAKQRPEAQHGVDAIIETANRWSGELEIVAQAPLTNLAMAFLKDPKLPQKVKRLWIMGGSNNFIGNISPAAEFNFYVDPEAAHIVMQAGFEIVLVPWDLCVNYGTLLRDELEPIYQLNTALSEFYFAINRAVWDFNLHHREGGSIDGITHPDSLTIALLLNPELVIEQKRLFVDVEYRSDLTRGYSLVDTFGVLNQPANAEVVFKANKLAFRDMLATLLGG